MIYMSFQDVTMRIPRPHDCFLCRLELGVDIFRFTVFWPTFCCSQLQPLSMRVVVVVVVVAAVAVVPSSSPSPSSSLSSLPSVSIVKVMADDQCVSFKFADVQGREHFATCMKAPPAAPRTPASTILSHAVRLGLTMVARSCYLTAMSCKFRYV